MAGQLCADSCPYQWDGRLLLCSAICLLISVLGRISLPTNMEVALDDLWDSCRIWPSFWVWKNETTLFQMQCVLKDGALPWLPRWSRWHRYSKALSPNQWVPWAKEKWRAEPLTLSPSPGRTIQKAYKKCALPAAPGAVVSSSQKRRLWSSGDWRDKLDSYVSWRNSLHRLVVQSSDYPCGK